MYKKKILLNTIVENKTFKLVHLESLDESIKKSVGRQYIKILPNMANLEPSKISDSKIPFIRYYSLFRFLCKKLDEYYDCTICCDATTYEYLPKKYQERALIICTDFIDDCKNKNDFENVCDNAVHILKELKRRGK